MSRTLMQQLQQEMIVTRSSVEADIKILYSTKEKAQLWKRAAEYGIMPTIRCFAKVHKERTLSPSTIFGWKESYLKEVAKRKHGEEPEVKELPPK